MKDVDYPKTPASSSVEVLAVVANEVGLPVFYLDLYQASSQEPLEKEI